MATETDLPVTRSPEPLTITVLRLRNLRGVKGDTLVSMLRLEWNEKVLGESVKVECTPDGPAEINYTVNINIAFSDPKDLDDIAHKPVLVSVIEVLPKEKKQKDEKTLLLGQCTIDLFHMLTADTSKHKNTLPVFSIPGSPLETSPPDVAKPELDFQLSVNEPLISSSLAQESNLMNITVESIYSPPESFQLSGQQYLYVASLPLPVSAEKESTLVYGNGSLKPGIDKEVPNKQKKWLLPGLSAQPGNAQFISNSYIASDPIDKEDGDFKAKDDREHRTVAETDKNRVTWNTERRCFLENSGCKALQEKIARNRLWPVEVMRMPVPAGGKGKKDEENQVYFHGVAYVNLAPLLYPGVTRIKGAYRIYPYTDQEYQEKSKRKHGTVEDALKQVHGQLNRGAASPFPKKGAKEEKKADGKKGMTKNSTINGALLPNQVDPNTRTKGKEAEESKGFGFQGAGLPQTTASVVHMPSLLASAQMRTGADVAADPEKVENSEGQQYFDSKSYLTLEIRLARPMVPKRPPAEVARRVAEYIPPRPAFPKRTNGAQKSVDDFHQQVASVAELILDEFRDNEAFEDLRKSLLENTGSVEEQRLALIYELNSSGKYFAFKEQLKHSVIKIVREKYLQTTSFKSQQELQMFLSELYVYLIDQMHVALSKYLSLEDKTPVPKPLTTTAQLKHFAQEAEVNEQFDLASKYYEERIARDPLDPEHWFDNGVFNLYINNKEKAEECFKKCISINQNHVNGLLMYGVVCAMEQRVELAELCFEKATNVAPNSVVAWTMLSLFYDGIDNDIGGEMAAIEANKINVDNARRYQRAAIAAANDTSTSGYQTHAIAGTQVDYEDHPPHSASSDLKVGDLDQGTKPHSPLSMVSERRDTVTTGAEHSKRTSRVSAAQVGVPASGKAVSRQSKETKKPGATSSKRGAGSATGSQMGSRTRSQESVNSAHRPVSKSLVTTPDHAEPLAATDPLIRESTPIPEQSIFMQTIAWLLETKATAFAERALANQLIVATKVPGSTPTAQYFIYMAQLMLQKKEIGEAETNLNEALQIDYQNADAWSYMGHLKYLLNERAEAKDCYERTLSFVTMPTETHSIYLRLASNYLLDGEYQNAKNTFLQACKSSPSCISWLGVGIACYRLNELSEAEDALSEANILNNEDSEVWGYLSLVCLKTGRQLEAEQAYKYALKLNLKDEDLLAEIRNLQNEVGFGNPQL